VEQFTQMGFGERDAEQALTASRGNFEQALDQLVVGRF